MSFWGPMLLHFKKSKEILETWPPGYKNLAFKDPPSLKFHNRTDTIAHYIFTYKVETNFVFTLTKVINFSPFISVVPWRLLKWCHVSKISISKISFNWSPNTGSKSKEKIQVMNSFTLSIWKKWPHAKRSHQNSS